MNVGIQRVNGVREWRADAFARRGGAVAGRRSRGVAPPLAKESFWLHNATHLVAFCDTSPTSPPSINDSYINSLAYVQSNGQDCRKVDDSLASRPPKKGLFSKRCTLSCPDCAIVVKANVYKGYLRWNLKPSVEVVVTTTTFGLGLCLSLSLS